MAAGLFASCPPLLKSAAGRHPDAAETTGADRIGPRFPTQKRTQCRRLPESPPNGKKPRDAGTSRQADARTRTGDPFITSEVLYQLSYVGAGRSEG